MNNNKYRIILLHPKDMDGEMVNMYAIDVADRISASMALRSVDIPFYVTPATDDWASYGSMGYEKWCNGLHERYDSAIVITERFGKATARIITSFIQNNKILRYYSKEGLSHIEELIIIDDTDWQKGWSVRLK